jgi:hypothetical protein
MVSPSLPDFLKTVCYILIFGAFWKTLAALWADKSLGQAMAWVY